MKHIVTFPDGQTQKLCLGQLQFVYILFRRRSDFLNKFKLGDLIYFRKKRGDVLGQFEVGKIILVQNVEKGEWSLLKKYVKHLSEEKFRSITSKNSILLVIQITKLEQFITSPVEIDKKSKKVWMVLDK